MKFVRCLIECHCGNNVKVKITPELIPLKGLDFVTVICALCNRKNVITYRDKIVVLCKVGTNEPAVFEDEKEVKSIYGNQN